MPKLKAVAEKTKKIGGPGRLRIPNGMVLLGIDPGDRHVGIAVFSEDPDGFPQCDSAVEYGHDEAVDFVVRQISANAVWGIALERFNLYEDQKDKQVGSDFPTCEQIGVIKYLVRVNNEWAGLTGDNDDGSPWSPPKIRLWLQGADIKKPIRAQMRAREIQSVAAKGGPEHARDAELHGWYRLLRGEDAP